MDQAASLGQYGERGLARFMNLGTGIYLVCLLAALALGAISVSESPVLIGAGAGAILGIGLLAVPVLTLWIVMAGCLVVFGLLMLYANELARLGFMFSMMGFLLMGLAYFKLLTRDAKSRPLPAFVVVGFIVPILMVAQSIPTDVSLTEIIAGYKRVMSLWGIFLIMAMLPLQYRDFRAWRKFMVVLLVIQIPFALHQLIHYVPLRLNMPHGVVPIDVVSGTFGGTVNAGGAAGEMTLILVTMLGFVLSWYQAKLINTWRALVLAAFCLAPLMIGENVGVVLFLPMMLIIVYRRTLLRNPVTMLIGLVLAGGTLVVLVYFYLSMFGGAGGPEAALVKLIDYNFGDVGYNHGKGLNRKTVLTFWAGQHGLANMDKMLFGYGLGSAFDGGGGLVPGYIGMKYLGQNVGLTAVATMLWETGLLGTLAWMLMLGLAFLGALRLARFAPNAEVRADGNGLAAAVALMAVGLFYKGFTIISYQAFFFFMLGYIAWALRHYGLSGTGAGTTQAGRSAASHPVRPAGPGALGSSGVPGASGPSAAAGAASTGATAG